MTVDKPTRIIYNVITGKPLKRLAVTFYVFIIFIITVHVATVGRLFFYLFYGFGHCNYK